MLAVAGTVARGRPLPTDATTHQWKWLLLSGLIGFFVGDVTSFRVLVLIGARLTTLIACTAPIFTLAAEVLALPGSRVGPYHLLGMAVTIAGVAWVVLERGGRGPDSHAKWLGVLLAIAGAAGQGVGAALAAKAFEQGTYNAFAAGQIRMLAGIAAFACFVGITGRARETLATLCSCPAMLLLSLGAFWGPFLGVSLFIQSLNYIPPSMTQTITGLAPVLIIPIAVIMGKERFSARALVGACVAVLGVWLLVHAPSRAADADGRQAPPARVGRGVEGPTDR